MSLPPGTRIGAFEITGVLGAGGMGEVYRARDAKLKREVALKVLPPDVAGDPERLARFQREAEVLASLNHPHIAHLYGLEEADGQRALVMELVEGTTLEERITRGAISIDEAIAIARQIIDALAAAHEQGIVHRDLKPANIKITPDGAVKVLDFGLARAFDPSASSTSALTSPTITSPAMTRAGMFLGTAAYMAPEQARGAVVDKRADIWAFGVVLFEMLSGRRLFDEATISDTLANVLKSEPDWARLPADTPLSMRRLLRRCLEKDRKRRLQDIGDARIELDELGSPGEEVVTPVAVRGSQVLRIASAFAAGVAVAGLAFVAWQARRPAAVERMAPIEFLITPLDGVMLDDPAVFAVSPNGEHILLRGYEGGSPFLYVKALRGAGAQPRRLNNTKGVGGAIFWSPDSQSIGFFRSNTVLRIGLDDSQPRVISNTLARVISGSWSRGGDIFVTDGVSLSSVSSSGGPVQVLVKSLQDAAVVNQAWALPDGRQFLVSNNPNTNPSILLGNTDGTSPRAIGSGAQPSFVPPDWLLTLEGQRLVARHFDQARGELNGEPRVIRENVRQRAGTPGRVFSASENGVLAIRNDNQAMNTRLAWFDRSGGEKGRLKLTRHCRNPEFSPDQSRVAMECYEDGAVNRDIWVYDLSRDVATRLTVDPSDDADPLWSPDGRTIVFASTRLGPADVFRKSVSGATPEELVLETPGPTPTMSWSPDGKRIAVMTTGPGDLSTIAMDGERVMEPAVTGPFQEIEFQFSPDGRYFSYSSDESGRLEVYVQRWPQTGDRWQISTDGGTDARWRADGKELFFLSPARVLVSVTLDTIGGFKAGAPVAIFQTRVTGPLGSGHRFPYAIAKDGKRFLMYVSDATTPSTISVIFNWPALIAK